MYGHGLLAETIFKQHLLDVLDISIHPVFAGSGKSLFRDGQTANMKLVSTKSFSDIRGSSPMSRSTERDPCQIKPSGP